MKDARIALCGGWQSHESCERGVGRASPRRRIAGGGELERARVLAVHEQPLVLGVVEFVVHSRPLIGSVPSGAVDGATGNPPGGHGHADPRLIRLDHVRVDPRVVVVERVLAEDAASSRPPRGWPSAGCRDWSGSAARAGAARRRCACRRRARRAGARAAGCTARRPWAASSTGPRRRRRRELPRQRVDWCNRRLRLRAPGSCSPPPDTRRRGRAPSGRSDRARSAGSGTGPRRRTSASRARAAGSGRSPSRGVGVRAVVRLHCGSRRVLSERARRAARIARVGRADRRAARRIERRSTHEVPCRSAERADVDLGVVLVARAR